MKILSSLAIAVVVMAGTPAFAQAPAPLDARWTPWLGCWNLVQDASEASPPSTAGRRPFTPGTNPADISVCVLPNAADAGVKMTTFAGGRSVLEQRVLGDGVSHAIAEPECRGTQTSEWSRDGERLFTRAELACGGQPIRRISSVTLLAPQSVWLDIQTIDVDGDPQVRVRRYVRAADQPAEGAGLPANMSARAMIAAQALSANRMTIEDVIEASAKIDSQTVEAALLETNSRFDLDSRSLIALGDGGVTPDVIDLMVALSFPGQFRVERVERTASAPVITGGGGYPGMYGSAGMYGSVYGSPAYGGYYPYSGYDPYAYYYYSYSPFAYGYWDMYPSYVFGGIPPAIIIPGGGSGETPGAHGRVIQGRGYTQVTPSGSSDSGTTSSSGTGTRTRSTQSEPSGGSSSTPSSGSGSSGGVSGDGYSSGSSGGSGRTAQPR